MGLGAQGQNVFIAHVHTGFPAQTYFHCLFMLAFCGIFDKKNMINVLLLLSFFFSDLATGEKSKNTSFSGNFLDLSKKMTLNRLSAKYESGKVVKREGLLIFISQRSHCIITFS